MLRVQKFGGSSLASVDHIRRVAEKVKAARERGDKIVAVVSAMGDSTDDLVIKATSITPHPSAREMDNLLSTGEIQSAALMAITLESLGIPSRSVSGLQAGIETDVNHGRARIKAIHPTYLQQLLEEGIVPVVTGFQGATESGDVTTLGRGGSDLTAIALANALKAEHCEIYSDVAGIYTADPRIIPTAVPLGTVNYDEMLELASQGAQVLQTQAVEFARGNNVQIHARSTFVETPGTVIYESDTKNAVTAIAVNRHIAKMGLRGVPDSPGVAAFIFGQLAEASINVELVFQAMSHDHLNDIAFTIEESDVDRAKELVTMGIRQIGGQELVIDTNVAKISVVGSGMLGRPGIAALVFKALADAAINIQMIGTSEIKISVIVARDQSQQAIKQIHDLFHLQTTIEE